MNYKLTGNGLQGISTSLLLDELVARVMRLDRAAARVRSVGRLRELVQVSYNAGEMAGAAERLAAVALRLTQALDEATANAPEPPETNEATERLAAEQGQRRALWLAIEKLRTECAGEVVRLRDDARKRHKVVAQRTDEALEPEAPLRVRVGRWLYTRGVLLAEGRTLRGMMSNAGVRT